VEHNCRREELIQQRIQAVYTAVAAIDDPVVIEACTRKTETLLHLIRCLRQEVAGLEKRIRTLTEEHPDAPIFASFPGAGPATVPRLIAAFGTCRDAYANASDVQRISGVAPVNITSGNAKSTPMRRACPKFLRQTFHEFAGQSIPYSTWANRATIGAWQMRSFRLGAICVRWPHGESAHLKFSFGPRAPQR